MLPHEISAGVHHRIHVSSAEHVWHCIVHRYGLVRVRENAESIAFYGGEGSEQRLLGSRLGAAVANYAKLLIASRNLQFFTSFYRQDAYNAARPP